MSGTPHPSENQLVVGVLRKVALSMLFDNFLVFGDDFLQRLGIEFGIKLHLALLLLAIEYFVELVLFDIEHNIAEHLN